MRIFYAAEYKYPIQRNSKLWYNNLYLPLVDCGYEVIPFDYNITPHYLHLDFNNFANHKFIDKNRYKLEDALLKQIKLAHSSQKIDIFFSYFYSAVCRPEIIEEIKKMGIITINWYCNASYQFHLVKDIAPAFDYCLVPEKFRIEDYKHIGANPVYFQEAANPNIYKPYNLLKTIDVCFAGLKYGDRVEFVNYLTANKINVNVYGDGWKTNPIKSKLKAIIFNKREVPLKRTMFLKTFGSVSDEEYIQLYSLSKINLGFSSCGNTHIGENRILQIRLRDFEAPMCGAFYMTEYQEEIEDFFEVDKEIVCYKSKEELSDKIRYYLKNDSDRDKISLAGYKRAIKEHTWQKRFKDLFERINYGR